MKKKILIPIIIFVILIIVITICKHISKEDDHSKEDKNSIKDGYDFEIYCGESITTGRPLSPGNYATTTHYYIYSSEKKVRVYNIQHMSIAGGPYLYLKDLYKISNYNIKKLQYIINKVIETPNDFLEENTDSYLRITYNNIDYTITKRDSVEKIEKLFKK